MLLGEHCSPERRHDVGDKQRNAQVDLAALDWPEGARFAFSDELGEHDPCYVVMPGGASLPVNHHDRQGVDIARARFIVDAGNAALDQAQHDRDDDETYEIGKRDGREEAVQEIDRLTGGDGEYFYSTLPGRGCPGPADMIKNIADRFVTLRARAEKAEAEVARLVALEWRETDDDARDGERMNLCWKAFGGISAHVELGRWSAAKMTWVNTYGRPFSGEPDYYQRLPEPPASRPDPAQPSQSSAQPAAELAAKQMIEFAQRWRDDAFEAAAALAERYGQTYVAGDIRALKSAPPAAGSAAGVGE